MRPAFFEAAKRYGLTFRGQRALCPWHEDSHPDLAFYRDGKCYCHACHHGGAGTEHRSPGPGNDASTGNNRGTDNRRTAPDGFPR